MFSQYAQCKFFHDPARTKLKLAISLSNTCRWQDATHIIWAAAWEKTTLCTYAKTKTQISFAETLKLISAFVFATWIVQYLYFLNKNFKPLAISSGCTAWFVSDLVRIQIVGFLTPGLILHCTYEINNFQINKIVALLKTLICRKPYLLLVSPTTTKYPQLLVLCKNKQIWSPVLL